jgi:hypothetical protein
MGPNNKRNFCGHCDSPGDRGPSKQEPTTLILPFGSNKQHRMDKEGFYFGSVV